MSSAETIVKGGTPPVEQQTFFAKFSGPAFIFAQLGLIALVLRNATIETLGFHRIVYIATFGFLVNHFLPARFRLNFFLALSIASMVVALGGTADSRLPDPALGIARAGLIICIGIVLIAICRLPISFWKRGLLLVCAGSIAAVFRSGKWNNLVLAVVWPVLAALFMFRIIVYLYDTSTSSHRPTKTQSLAYFFLTPNFCALLFPVIDFHTFCQTYYNEEPLRIYQRGIKWMTRGIVQLLAFRLIDRLFALDASAVANGTDLIRFVATNVFLYLKVSGSFHLYIGMLLLFGFNLPETNHRYFLSSSFTDYWRRVNIYWRAFIMKVFYYPTFFRFKKRGQTEALIIATLWCFFVTWFLHIYQTWWIRADITLRWTDALFWTSLGLLVLVNSLMELKGGKKQKLTKRGFSPKEAAGIIVRTGLTFVVITVLWSLWNTSTLKLWVHIWSLADLQTLEWGGAILAVIALATLYFEILPASHSPGRTAALAGGVSRAPVLGKDFLKSAIPLCLIYAATFLPARIHESPKTIEDFPIATQLVESLLNSDIEGHGGGYYQNLTAPDDGSARFWEAMTHKFKREFILNKYGFGNAENVHQLMPNIHIQVNGMPIDTNRWGMRDRDRALTKPPGTVRMAVLGSSHVVGYGLPAKEMFVPLLEDRLNNDRAQDGRFEMLNFAISGQSSLGQIWMIRHQLAPFHPDIVIFVTHLIDFEWTTDDAEKDFHRNIPLPSDFPTEIFAKADVSPRTIEAFAVQRLQPYQPQILSSCYRQMVRECREIHALPVCVFLPVPNDLPLDTAKSSSLLQIAADAGFTVIDLSNVFAGHAPSELMLPDVGKHSNAEANALIAQALYERLTTDPRIGLLDRAMKLRASNPRGSPAAQSSN